MKRIAILCDGTWNRADAEEPTNVVKVAQALRPIDPTGIVQVPIYIQGVGTGEGVTRTSRFLDKTLGGAFGRGLLDNLVEAYRHIVFLYEPGDEVFIFGFSRGAYTARSLAGFLRSSGIVPRHMMEKIPLAVNRYRTIGNPDYHPATEDSHAFRTKELCSTVATSTDEQDWRERNGYEQGPLFRINYVGVWDSVGALGVPAQIPIIGPMTQKKYRFHDASLSSMVASARHAVAIDEHRAAFLPTNWDNVETLTTESGRTDRPYRQEYFAGDHGSVGGGGDITGLSSIALDWVIQGALEAGLSFDGTFLAETRKQFDPDAPLRNFSNPKSNLIDKLMRRNKTHRKGPASITDVHSAALQRWVKEVKSSGVKPYRPKTLEHLKEDIIAWHAEETGQDKGDTRIA